MQNSATRYCANQSNTCWEEPGEGEEDPPEAGGHPKVVDENEDRGAEEAVLALAAGRQAGPGHQLIGCDVQGRSGTPVLSGTLEATGYRLE